MEGSICGLDDTIESSRGNSNRHDPFEYCHHRLSRGIGSLENSLSLRYSYIIESAGFNTLDPSV